MNIVRKSLVMIGGSAGISLASAIQGIMIARGLGPAGTGQVQLVLNLSVLIATFCMFGIGQANIYILNNKKDDIGAVVANSVTTSIILGLLAAGIMYGVVVNGDSYAGQFNHFVIAIFALGTFITLMANILRPILLSQLRVVQFNVSQIISIICSVFFIGAAWLNNRLTVVSALIIIACTTLAGLLYTLILLRPHLDIKNIIHIDREILQKTLKYGFSVYLVNLLMTMDQNISVVILSYLLPGEFESIGFYSRAVAICTMMRFIPLSLSNLFYAQWSGIALVQRVVQAEKVLGLTFLAGIILVAFLFLAGKHIIVLMYGLDFLPSFNVLIILSLQQVLWTMSRIFQSLFYSSGAPLLTAVNMLVINLLSVVMMFLLIPRYGIIGAAQALLVSHLVSLSINFWLAKKQFGLNITRSFLFRTEDLAKIYSQLSTKKHE